MGEDPRRVEDLERACHTCKHSPANVSQMPCMWCILSMREVLPLWEGDPNQTVNGLRAEATRRESYIAKIESQLASLTVEFKRLKEQIGWTPASEPPVKPGEYSKEVFEVITGEFMQPRRRIFATCWVSVLHPLIVKWYLSQDHYPVDGLVEIGEVVTHYRRLVPMPTEVEES